MVRSAQQLQKIANAEKCLGDYVPFSSEIAPGVVKLKNFNGYLTTFEIEGVPFETAGEDQIDEYNLALHQFISALSGGAYALWTHKVHMRVHEQLQDNFTNDYSQKLAAQYRKRLTQTRLMRTSMYLTVLYRPGELAVFKNVASGSSKQMAALEREGIDQISDIAARVAASLRRYKPRRLMRFERNGLQYSELLSFLHFTVNGHWRDMPVTHRRVADLLCTSRLTAGDRSGVLQLTSPDRIRYVSCLEIKDYPEKVSPLSLSKTLYLDQEYIETQSFSILGNRTALTRLRQQRGQLKAGGEASETEIQEFDQLLDQVNHGSLVVGEYHYSLAIFSDTLDDKGIKRDRSEAAAALEEGGFKTEVQTTVPEGGWFFQMPGNWRWRSREALLTSWNFCSLSPLHNFMAGKKTGNPWGEAVCIFDSPSGQPFFFNFHCSPEDHDNTDDKLPANACIFGKTGVGKTTTEMFLMAHLNKFRSRVFILDLDRSTEITVRRMGGTYKQFARGVPTGLNPFQWPDSTKTRAFCRDLVTQCLTFGRSALTADEENRLSLAIDAVFGMRVETRRLAMLHQNLPGVGMNSLQDRLARWIGDGDLAWVLDNPTDTLNLEEAEIWGFDGSDFIDDAQVCPVVTMCLLHLFEDMIDGRPIALFLEEFWKYLGSPVFSKFVKDKLKTIRKEQGFVVMATQQPDDVLATELAKTAVQQHVTGLFLPNPRAAYVDYVTGFGLTPQEFEILRSLPVDSRAFLVKQEDRSAIVRLDLTGMHETIAVLSGDTESSELLAEIRSQVGDDASDWEPIFIERMQQKRAGKKLVANARAANAQQVQPLSLFGA
ncbi:VirB4 family type IV secretion/conjugal transfer ATPase [Limnohabitans sp. JUR4]|uniref:VirB4 family type IV secretion/conjugal transfer ATPase n=1 Tax=Limnohabitans radicicola TaxID=2771427 RepID=A0A927IMD3_9BURK|nr:VirB4 family type IV secretion/conjugal transfer ATPase [Limnohabitans radicicola]